MFCLFLFLSVKTICLKDLQKKGSKVQGFKVSRFHFLCVIFLQPVKGELFRRSARIDVSDSDFLLIRNYPISLG